MKNMKTTENQNDVKCPPLTEVEELALQVLRGFDGKSTYMINTVLDTAKEMAQSMPIRTTAKYYSR